MMPSHTAAPLSGMGVKRHSLPVLYALLLTLIGVGTVYMAQPLLGVFGAEFGITPAEARISFGWPMLCYAVAFFLFGPLTDVVPVERMMSLGGVIAGVALVMASQASTFNALVVWLCLAGAGAALIPSASFALVPRIAAPERVGFFFGLLISASIIGLTLGRSMSGISTGAFGWRLTYGATGAVLALAAGALTLLPRTADGAEKAAVATAAGIGSAYQRVSALLIQRKVLHLMLIGAFLFFGYLGLTTLLTLRLQSPVFGLSVEGIGWIGLTGLVAVIGAPAAGSAITRIGAKRVAAAALIAVLAGSGLVIMGTHWAIVSLGLILLFGGVFSCQPAVLVLLSRVTPANAKGAISSIYMVVCLGTGGLSSVVLGPIWNWAGWAGVGGLCFISAGLAFLLVWLVPGESQSPGLAS